MRFTSISLFALPLLASAQQGPFDQIMLQVQPYLDKIAPYIPNPNRQHIFESSLSEAGARLITTLTLDNWKETLMSSVTPGSPEPEAWWVLMSGNKTCYKMCEKIETAFNESALLLAATPSAPHLGYIDCDFQPLLCNSWAAGPPALWTFEIPSTPGKPVNVRLVGLNTTSTTAETFIDLQATGSWKTKPLHDGYFHPTDGPIAMNGFAVPIAYLTWVFSMIPSWAFMIGISFLSRTMMSSRLPGGQPSNKRATAPPPAAPAGVRVGAPPGDGVSY